MAKKTKKSVEKKPVFVEYDDRKNILGPIDHKEENIHKSDWRNGFIAMLIAIILGLSIKVMFP